MSRKKRNNKLEDKCMELEKAVFNEVTHTPKVKH